MYPEDLIQPMRQELIDAGLNEIRSADEVKKNIESEGTTFVVINSVWWLCRGQCASCSSVGIEGQ